MVDSYSVEGLFFLFFFILDFLFGWLNGWEFD